jgi:hypothetical protein
MATNRLHLSARRTLVAAVFATAVLVHAGPAAAYGWPVKPFDRQHPVRGFFGDPRIHRHDRALHFGVDISAPDGTPVYATVSGPVAVHTPQHDVVSIRLRDGSAVEYWHVVPTIAPGARAVAYRTVIGRVGRGWGHVHLAEIRGGRYVNPLREGGLSPYRDETRPSVRFATFERAGRPVGRTVRGTVALVAEALDETPLPVPPPWTDKPVAPALVRWRIVGETRWRVAIDFRGALPSSPFESVYAPWTRQNHPWSRGRYRFVLAARFDSRVLPDGRHRLEVVATDTRANAGRLAIPFTVANRVAAASFLDAAERAARD